MTATTSGGAADATGYACSRTHGAGRRTWSRPTRCDARPVAGRSAALFARREPPVASYAHLVSADLARSKAVGHER